MKINNVSVSRLPRCSIGINKLNKLPIIHRTKSTAAKVNIRAPLKTAPISIRMGILILKDYLYISFPRFNF